MTVTQGYHLLALHVLFPCMSLGNWLLAILGETIALKPKLIRH